MQLHAQHRHFIRLIYQLYDSKWSYLLVKHNVTWAPRVILTVDKKAVYMAWLSLIPSLLLKMTKWGHLQRTDIAREFGEWARLGWNGFNTKQNPNKSDILKKPKI